MGVQINNLKQHGYFKIRVFPADSFDPKDKDEAEQAEAWGDAFIDLRELNATEAAEFYSDRNKFMERLADVIVDHNFFQDDEGKKRASNEQVAEEIRRSSTVYNHVMTEWGNSLPLAKRNTTSSEK